MADNHVMNASAETPSGLRGIIGERRFALALTLLFLVCGAFVAWRHEMWRDEMQAWLIARDSTSLIDLVRNLKYEGHPILWYLCLRPLARLGLSPVAMQVFHLLVATATIYILAAHSPFTRLQKALFAFGYFPFYEYSILCRNYALGVLLFFAFCALFQQRNRRVVSIALILFLAAQTSVHALVVSIALAFGLVRGWFHEGKSTASAIGRRRWAGVSVIALGFVIGIMQIAPASDALEENIQYLQGRPFSENWYPSLPQLLTAPARAFVPVPAAVLHFQDSLWVHRIPGFVLWQPIVSVLILIWCCLVVSTNRVALFVYLLGALGLFALFYLVYDGSTQNRHSGFFFLLFIVVAWAFRTLRSRPGRLETSHNAILTAFLVVHVLGGLVAARMDWIHPYSQGKAVAELIRERGWQDMLIAADLDYAGATVVGYLGKDRIYYPRGSRFGSFTVQDNARAEDLSDEQLLVRIRTVSASRSDERGLIGTAPDGDVVLLLNRPLDARLARRHGVHPVGSAVGAVIRDESYWIYRVNGSRPH